MPQQRTQSASEEALNCLAIELFRMFSRFEYALKATGFHNGDGDAKPNWRDFALSIETQLQNPHSTELQEAIEYLLRHAPKKQMIKNGIFEWSDAKPDTNSRADLILQYIRRIRNNLFHGGKFNQHWFDPERDKELLRHSLIILKGCLEASPKVTATYHS
jgi:hypothetical protein